MSDLAGALDGRRARGAAPGERGARARPSRRARAALALVALAPAAFAPGCHFSRRVLDGVPYAEVRRVVESLPGDGLFVETSAILREEGPGQRVATAWDHDDVLRGVLFPVFLFLTVVWLDPTRRVEVDVDEAGRVVLSARCLERRLLLFFVPLFLRDQQHEERLLDRVEGRARELAAAAALAREGAPGDGASGEGASGEGASGEGASGAR